MNKIIKYDERRGIFYYNSIYGLDDLTKPGKAFTMIRLITGDKTGRNIKYCTLLSLLYNRFQGKISREMVDIFGFYAFGGDGKSIYDVNCHHVKRKSLYPHLAYDPLNLSNISCYLHTILRHIREEHDKNGLLNEDETMGYISNAIALEFNNTPILIYSGDIVDSNYNLINGQEDKFEYVPLTKSSDYLIFDFAKLIYQYGNIYKYVCPTGDGRLTTFYTNAKR